MSACPSWKTPAPLSDPDEAAFALANLLPASPGHDGSRRVCHSVRHLHDGKLFSTAIPGTALTTGPATLANYISVIRSPLAQDAALDTLRLAALMTGIIAALGYPLAYVLARTPSRRVRRIVLFGLVVTFLSGGVTRAYAWLIILGNRGLINQLLQALGFTPMKLVYNETGVVTGVVHFLLPFFVLTLFAALKNIPASLEEAARNLGADRWRVFLHVVLPLSVPGLFSAATLCFAGALSAFLFPELLGGGRVHMAANWIYESVITDFNLPRVAAMAALFLLLALGALGLPGLIQRLTSRPGIAP
jgi:putative spermidine/putrescine transport system permease protein